MTGGGGVLLQHMHNFGSSLRTSGFVKGKRVREITAKVNCRKAEEGRWAKPIGMQPPRPSPERNALMGRRKSQTHAPAPFLSTDNGLTFLTLHSAPQNWRSRKVMGR